MVSAVHYRHPKSKCVISGHVFPKGHIGQWNCRADLAVPAHVRVKPLVWAGEYRPVASPQTYQIWPDNGGSGAPDDPIETFDGFMLYSPTMMCLGIHQTIESAKTAAQADYEARILSALTIQPADPLSDPRVVALVEAAKVFMHDVDDLIANSEGVSGLHMNGDVADWESLLPGGSFGSWLFSVDDFRAALRAIGGEA